MRLNRSGYLIREGFRSIGTHGFMSFATVTIIMACLIIMGSVTLLSLNIDRLIKGLENQNEVVAFVDETYSEDDARALQSQIDAIDNISSAAFVTRGEAFDSFMENYSTDLAEGLDDQVLRDRFVIHLTDIAMMEQTKAELENIEGIAKVKAHLDYARTFVTIRNVVSVVSLALIAMLVFVSIFIMSNTIKLATFGRREEIAIMKMVGASNGFIRLPFVVEGLVLGILGGGLGFLAEWGLYELLTKKLVGSVAGSIFAVVPFAQIALPMLIAYLAIGVLIGAFGGVNAIKNYLEV
ncbi:MAG: permease-like cell division protein FtsX [Oscillospiraceae bacterium]|nr:permease-like cell division protein FtsX [Oscillospiraceae bacterium]